MLHTYHDIIDIDRFMNIKLIKDLWNSYQWNRKTSLRILRNLRKLQQTLNAAISFKHPSYSEGKFSNRSVVGTFKY